MITCDVAVVGAGSVGMAIAHKLARLEAAPSVAVLSDERHPSASAAAGAMLGCFGEVTKYTFAHEATRAKFDLMLDAHRAWSGWLAELQDVAGERVPTRPGTHIVLNAHGGSLDEDNFQAVIDALVLHEEEFESCDPRDIPGLDPETLARPLRAVFLPREGSLPSADYLRALRAACERSGVTFIGGSLNGAVRRIDGAFRLSGAEDVMTQSLVFAAGSRTSQALRDADLGIELMPVLSGNGVSAIVSRVLGAPFEHVIRTSNRAGSCGLHLVPLEGRREYLGATNIVSLEPDRRPMLGMSHFLTQCAIEQLSRSLFFSVVDRWQVGSRPVSLDTLPMIGKADEGVWIATGTFRDGLHCSPVIAEHLVSDWQGDDSWLTTVFAPTRPPIELMTQEQTIDEFSMQAMASAHENWLDLPYHTSPEGFLEQARESARAAYETLDTTLALHPDILFYLTSPEAREADLHRLGDYLARHRASASAL